MIIKNATYAGSESKDDNFYKLKQISQFKLCFYRANAYLIQI